MMSYVQHLRSLVGQQRLVVPGVRAIVVRHGGEVLLQRRIDMNCWGLPAGAVELDETVLETLKREVKEETDLEVLQAEPMAVYSGPSQRFVYPNGDQVQGFAIAFVIRKWTGTPRPCGIEGSDVRFWPLAHLPANMVPIHANTLADYGRYDGRFLCLGS